MSEDILSLALQPTCTEGCVLVRQGDTLNGLARALGVERDDIMAVNSLGLHHDVRLQAGSYLKVPCRYTVVQPGDTLWSISRRHRTSTDELNSLNHLQNHTIHEGNMIRIPLLLDRPLEGLAPDAEHLHPNAPAGAGGEGAQGEARILRRGDKAMVVQEGDTLWDISQSLGVPVMALIQANRGSTNLQPGQVLQIPRHTFLTPRGGEVRVPAASDLGAHDNHFFGKFRFTKSLEQLRRDPEVRKLLVAMRWVETSNIMPAPVGDGGKSIGPLQISDEYHMDAWSDNHYRDRPTDYTYCEDLEYAEQTSLRYMRRWVPWALQFGDLETLARTHNGGPAYFRAPKTARYWRKIYSAMNPYNFYDNPHFRDWGERQHRARSQGNKMQAVVVPLADDIQLHEFPILSIVRKGIVRIATLTNLDHLAKHVVLNNPVTRVWTNRALVDFALSPKP